MKNILLFLALLLPLPTFAIKILSVTNVMDTKSSNEARLGDVIKVNIDYEGVAVKSGPLYLVLEGKKLDIQSFDYNGQSASPQILYFYLDESKIGAEIDKIAPCHTLNVPVKLDIADASGNFTNVGKANLTLLLPAKDLLLIYQKWHLDEDLGVRVQTIQQLAELPAKKEDIKLFVEGILMEKATCSGVTRTSTGADIYFKVDGTEFGRAFYNNDSERIIDKISIGPVDKAIISTGDDPKAKLIVEFMRPNRKLSFWAMFIFMGVGLFLLASRSDILKDTVVGDIRKTYSLAKTQFAFWTFFILNGMIYILFTTKELCDLPSSAFILLGISAAIIVGGQLAEDAPGASATKKQGIVTGNRLKQFFAEILSDGNGISIHRLQNLMFTLFLGFYFWWEVINHLEIPQFGNNLLVLMGVSGVAYAAGKGMVGGDGKKTGEGQ